VNVTAIAERAKAEAESRGYGVRMKFGFIEGALCAALDEPQKKPTRNPKRAWWTDGWRWWNSLKDDSGSVPPAPAKRGRARTVGELRQFLAGFPDEMPLHQRGDAGSHPRGLTLIVRTLAEAKAEAGYYADVVNDPVWSKPTRRAAFGPTFKALCTP
jgi:hypothetical protein